MTYTELDIEVWVDDAEDVNFRYPGADVDPSIFVSIDGESRSEGYETLFVLGNLGAIADIPVLMQFPSLEDWVWEKINQHRNELYAAAVAGEND